jgi:dihydrofolate reductase
MLKGKKVAIIFATSVYAQHNRLVIGYKGDMPWRGKIPSDMDRFKDLTQGCSVALGPKTFWSIPTKYRPFDLDRQTLIISRSKDLIVNDPRVKVVRDLEEAATVAKSRTLWIAGGSEIFALALPFADYIHQTMIIERFPGDTFFPYYDVSEWDEVDHDHRHAGGLESPDDKLDTIYKIYKRKSVKEAA